MTRTIRIDHGSLADMTAKSFDDLDWLVEGPQLQLIDPDGSLLEIKYTGS